jgi:hypothetical protein
MTMQDRSWGRKSSSAGRRRKKNTVEFTVHLPDEEFELLKSRAEYYDRSISGQARLEIIAANRGFRSMVL